MSEVHFSPSSWQSGGRAMSRAVESWQSEANGIIQRISRPIDGADAGMTLADMAVATICPVVAGVLGEMVQTITESLAITGENMATTGAMYEATEGDNVQLAATISSALAAQ